MREKLEAALHEVDAYGIGATSNVNQKVIMQAVRAQREALEKIAGWEPLGDAAAWRMREIARAALEI